MEKTSKKLPQPASAGIPTRDAVAPRDLGYYSGVFDRFASSGRHFGDCDRAEATDVFEAAMYIGWHRDSVSPDKVPELREKDGRMDLGWPEPEVVKSAAPVKPGRSRGDMASDRFGYLVQSADDGLPLPERPTGLEK